MRNKKIKNQILLSMFLSIALTVGHFNDVKSITDKPALRRIYASDSIETSIKIAQELNSDSNTYVLATNDNYPDALAGTILASKYNAPILFTSKDDNTKLYDYLKSVNVNKSSKFYILGGTGVISQNVEDYLRNITDNVTRLGGSDRFKTCEMINEVLEVKPGTPVIITTGYNYPDALSISAIGGQLQYPILLTYKDSIPENIAQQLQKIKPSTVYITGGAGVISDSVAESVMNLTSAGIIRFAGSNRYDTSMKIADYFKDYISNDVYTTGQDFHDSLASAPLASANKASIILVDNDSYKEQQSLSRHKGFIIGSNTTLSDEVENYMVEASP